ncbi:class I SAM-dependent methyltransferase [Anaerosalibacter massiliensis]|uniref:Class I SAM-dependent methyltransferase n=1 Tax=Anaerosalibacter massiliensis TaxID=1347392 RepID=A0A9X2MJQ9_9FIRM|nr:class I SAM-dependent methyltransferase [Anaerosalibacter massiliensis]MCR2045303.1 class I SAM-dependent methyltransferase [Anaerosalibacter massiliensis]
MKLENIKCMVFNMKELPFNDNRFDGIVCVSTLSHGTFDDIRNYINEMYRVLKPKGMLITDILSIENNSFRIGKQIEKSTFIGSREGEEAIPHHYTNEEEIKELFSRFNELKIDSSEYIFDSGKDKEFISKVFDIEAIK